MMEEFPADYLAGLPGPQRDELVRVNCAGLAALRAYLASGDAVAFLGAGVSAPLYPLWTELIGELVDAAAGRQTKEESDTCRALAQQSPEEVVEIIRQTLGTGMYREVLREVLRVRTDPQTGRSWTPVQELLCRCTFKAVVTTNYDAGIVDARMRVRPGTSATGFITWEDELGLDDWRTGDVFGETGLPVLYAHGQHNRPDSVVLATTEYRRAYAGKLPQVLARLMDGHLAWIGFSFADQRITAILREIADRTGTKMDPDRAPRHVALMAWDPNAGDNDPQVQARRAQIGYGAHLVLYPAPGGDHGALRLLLAALVDDRFPPAAALPASPAAAVKAPARRPGKSVAEIPATWVPPVEGVEHFTGRAEELARLNRWAADPQVALIGVTAWGGAGKTTLATHWVREAGGVAQRPNVCGVFGWSFYADPSAEHWADGLLKWAKQSLGIAVTRTDRVATAVLSMLRVVPVLLILDGLEVMQEGPAGGGFGQLLDGTLREVLTGVCQQLHGGLVMLTSRFPFADLETFDGGSARMLEVPPFTLDEGAELLASAGGGWLAYDQRRALVAAVDGHALATGVLAGLLAAHPPASDLTALHADLAAAARTDARVGKVLQYYSGRLYEADRYLLAAVSLFAQPVPSEAVLVVTRHEVFSSWLARWTPAMVQAAVRDRLGGLASWHPDGTISAHPLVRSTFRPLVMDAAETAAETALTGIPAGELANRADALRVVEAIELLLDAGQWQPADDIFISRSGRPPVWSTLPAPRLGQRACIAFVATTARRDACASILGPTTQAFYLANVGLFATEAGDLVTAQQYLLMAVGHYRDMGNLEYLNISLRTLALCLGEIGEVDSAREAATEALDCARKGDDQSLLSSSHSVLGWLEGLAGDSTEAEQSFIAADKLALANTSGSQHLFSRAGIFWAEWLARTGCIRAAQTLNDNNRKICQENNWNDDAARCDRILGRLALSVGETSVAGEHLAAAVRLFRDGDHLPELATTLVDLAGYALAAGNPGAAAGHVTEAITIAAPRNLVPAQSSALAARAKVCAAQATATINSDNLARGRDASDAALRLATRHHLAWHELDALRAHALLDQAQGTDHGWRAKAEALNARLVPPDLDPDQLTTLERLVAAQDAAEQATTGPEED